MFLEISDCIDWSFGWQNAPKIDRAAILWAIFGHLNVRVIIVILNGIIWQKCILLLSSSDAYLSKLHALSLITALTELCQTQFNLRLICMLPWLICLLGHLICALTANLSAAMAYLMGGCLEKMRRRHNMLQKSFRSFRRLIFIL